MQETLDENPPICDYDEVEEDFIGTVDVTKECPDTEEEEISSDDETVNDPVEEPVEEPVVEEESKVSSLQAAMAAMKTTDTEPTQPVKKTAAPYKKNSAPGKFSSSVKKKNTPRKLPTNRPVRGGGRSTKGGKGKNSRMPALPRGGKRKAPVVRKVPKTSEKKKSFKAPSKKKSSPPKEDEKTCLRLRFVIGENC